MGFNIRDLQNCYMATQIQSISGGAATHTGHLLEIKVRVSPPRDPPVSTRGAHTSREGHILFLSGELSVGGKILSEVQMSDVSADFYFHGDWILTLRSALTPLMVEKLEEVRGGDAIQFQLRYSGLLESEGVVARITDSIFSSVPQSEWIKELPKLGRWEHAIIEVPVPPQPPKGSPELKHAFDQINAAKRHFLAGDYRDAVADCREVYEKLRDLLKDAATPRPELYGPIHVMSAHSKADRLRLLRTAAMVYTHPAHHAGKSTVDGTPPGQFSRTEAYNMLAITGAIYSMVVHDLP